MIDGKDIKPGAITNTNVNSSAGIELKKLEKGGSGQIVVTDSGGTQKYVNLSGDVTVDTDGVASVSATVSSGGTGTVGPQGAAGPQGPQGPEGDQGDAGPPGSDASVTKANIDDALYGADTTTLGFVKRTANDDYGLDTSTYSTTGHTHDDRYYTETEVNTSLAGKENTFSKNTAFNKNFGAATGDVCQGDDSRLSNARTPSSTLAHKSTHETGESDALSPSDIGAESAFSKNTAFNKDFGTASGDVCQGNDSRLSDARTPATHASTHATSAADAIAPSDIGAEPSFSKNTAHNKNFGTAAGTVCQGNDSRLSDARTPSSTLAHKASHETGGTDALSPSDIGASADTHTHDGRYFQESEFLNASAGAGDAGKPVKLDAGGKVDATMINDGDISYGSIADVPSTFAPSSHTHAHADLTSIDANQHLDWTASSAGTIHSTNYTDTTYSVGDGGLTQKNFTTADNTKLDACLEVDDSSSASTKTWSAAKIASNALAVMGLGYLHPVDKYTAAFEWERTLAISETGWGQGSGSGSWQANQTHASLAQTSTSGSGTGALFNVAVSSGGVPTFVWVSGGGGYAVDDTLTFTDPGSTSETCVVTVTAVVTPTGISFSGTSGSMVCTVNHQLDTEHVVVVVRDENKEDEDVGYVALVTVIDADNVKLEYDAPDYPDPVNSFRYVTIMG